MPLQRCPGGGYLPFRLRGQAGPRPARERVRLVITDMADRLRRVELPHPCQRYRQPLSVLFLPVERAFPSSIQPRRPTLGQPQLGPLVTAVNHEHAIFGIGHRPVCQRERLHENPMPRRFVIVGKAVAVIPDPGQSLWKRKPGLCRQFAAVGQRLAVDGM